MLPYLSMKKLFVLAALTLLAAYAYNFLPERRLVLAPGAAGDPVLIYDGRNGGNSHAYWDKKHASKAICELRPSETFPFCGFLLSLGDGETKGIDFSRYQGIRISFTYAGPAPRLRIYMRNHEPLLSEAGKPETAKFNNLTVAVEDLQQPLYLDLHNFTVAEWWLEAYSVPRELAQPAFFNVIKFGFDLPDPPPYGRHELQLDRLELVGQWFTKDQWYLGILLLWITISAVWVGLYKVSIRRRELIDHQRIAEVVSGKEQQQMDPTDNITGAISRAGLSELISRYYSADGCNTNLSLMLFDIDDFRKINKRFGHDTGNKILVDISEILLNNSRASDIICHWANDRFLVIAPLARGVELAAFAEKIRNLVRQHDFESEGRRFNVSVSAGVAEVKPGDSFETGFKQASRTLLQAKAAGKDAVNYLAR